MAVVFRCDAGPALGLGHLMRCRTLAAVLRERGEQCVMVGPSSDYATDRDRYIFSDWVPIARWQSSPEDAAQIATIAKKHKARSAVVDDYRVDEAYQLMLRQSGLRWLQFDGAARTSMWATWVLNSSPVANQEAYAPLTRNPASILLLGSKYAILRSEFLNVPRPSFSRPVRRVLVTFGGGDDRGAIEFVLSSVLSQDTKGVEFLVVCGSNNPRNTSLLEWVRQFGDDRVTISVEPPDVARSFASCDLAIMSGGGSTYEAACCRVPMLLLSISENQTRHSAAWQKVGGAMFLGDLGYITKPQLQTAFNQLLSDRKKRAEYCVIAHSICDGLGASRVADAILE